VGRGVADGHSAANEFEACPGELRPDPSLAKLSDIESAEKIPKSSNLSRFPTTLGQGDHRAELEAVFKAMVRRQK